MNGQDWLDLTEWALLGISLLFALVLWVPGLLRSLGLECYRCGVQGGPGDLPPEGKGERYREMHRQLLALGAAPLGVFWERVAFGRRHSESAFLLRQESCLASVFQLPGDDPRVVFTTVFTSGAVVKTFNFAHDPENEADCIIRGVPNLWLEKVLDSHRESVARLCETGHVPRSCDSLEEFAEAERSCFFHPRLHRNYRRGTWQALHTSLGSVIVLPALLGLLLVAGDAWMGLPCLCFLLFGLLHLWQQQKQRSEKGQQLTSEQEARTPPAHAAEDREELEIPRNVRRILESPLITRSARFADWLARWSRPLVFDLQRGWLEPGEKFDALQTIACARSADDPGSEVPRWVWEEAPSRRSARKRGLALMLSSTSVATLSMVVLILGLALLGNLLTVLSGGPAPTGSTVVSLFDLGGKLSALLFVLFLPLSSFRGWKCWPEGSLKQTETGPVLEFFHLFKPEATPKPLLRCQAPLREECPGRFVLHGTVRIWHVSGEKAGEIEFVDGRPHGPVTIWHLNGQERMTGQWQDGRKVGTWARWDRSGQVVGREVHEQGRPVQSEGKFHDPWDELERYHWTFPITFDRGALRRQARSALSNNSRSQPQS